VQINPSRDRAFVDLLLIRIYEFISLLSINDETPAFSQVCYTFVSV
jgi:hypothetical protein